MKKFAFLFVVLLGLLGYKGNAQKQATKFSEKYYNAITWRNIGPFRGGRSSAVTGVKGKPNLFYFGASGGGFWHTTDSGNTYKNISDGFFGGSIGSVAVSDWDNNVIYVGGGEETVRGNVSDGDGVWKSVNAGKTWKHMGLPNSRHIPRIRIDPKNPDIVYAAVLGDLYKPTQERGVYKSTNGGETWRRVLFSNANAGAIDLVIDPNNSRILYASTWRVNRTPYSLNSGGKGSALWKSTDSGETWKNISSHKGLPKGIWGISGISVSPVNSDIVYAIIENKNGGVYKSIDAGKTWKLVNKERKLRQRAWYYSRIYADTQDKDIVYVLNVQYHKSTDGGKTYKTFNAPHGDHHDLWIAPEDDKRMIIADDGGAQISFDAGVNWSTYNNQPTAQFYRVVTDNHFPYRIYGAQQDNSAIRIAHRTGGRYITDKDWGSTAGGESAHIAVDPLNNDIVYGGSYGAFLTRVDHKNKQTRAINVWPDDPMGHGAKDFKYRFQWNFPIFFSPNNPKKLYAASNHLHVTTNEGQSWQVISPDLTRNDPKTLKSSGGPITQDNTGVEYYGTIFAAAESPYEPNLIWTGSDDGLVYVTKDGGKNWTNVTPKKMPKWMMINSIDIDPFHKGGVYIAGTKYKSGDYHPYLYKTEDYGKSWKLIVNGIPNEYFTRVVRADKNRKGLLYAGTEKGMFISFDDGANWEKFQLNLPIVPITDLTIKDNNLIAATQGRAFWIIDDLSPLYQLNNNLVKQKNILYKPQDTYDMGGARSSKKSKTQGQNRRSGVAVNFYIKDTLKANKINLTFKDANGKLIRTFKTKPDKKKHEGKLKLREGDNVFYWNMMYPGAEKVKGMILWWASLAGPKAIPGTYNVELNVNGKTQTQTFKILKDPRSSSSIADLKAKFDFILSVRDKLTETHKALKNIKKIRDEVTTLKKAITDKKAHKDLIAFADDIVKRMTVIENNLYQTKSKSGQDPLNFPIKLNNKLAHLNSLAGMGSFKPTDQDYAFKKQVTAAIDKQLKNLYKIFNTDVKQLNAKVKASGIDLIKVDKNI